MEEVFSKSGIISDEKIKPDTRIGSIYRQQAKKVFLPSLFNG